MTILSVTVLKQVVSKIEKLNEEKDEVQECIREAYNEAKSQGYDVKILRKVIAMRKKPLAELSEEEELLKIYFEGLA